MMLLTAFIVAGFSTTGAMQNCLLSSAQGEIQPQVPSQETPKKEPSKKKKKKRKKKKASGAETKPPQCYYDLYATGDDGWTPVRRPEIRRANLQMFAPSIYPVSDSGQRSSTGNIDSPATVLREGRGFRVQLANVMDEAEAMAIKEKAENSYKSVYIIFQSPNYKVRVGNYRVRSEADDAAEKALKLGFRDAWVVPTKIELNAPGASQ